MQIYLPGLMLAHMRINTCTQSANRKAQISVGNTCHCYLDIQFANSEAQAPIGNACHCDLETPAIATGNVPHIYIYSYWKCLPNQNKKIIMWNCLSCLMLCLHYRLVGCNLDSYDYGFNNMTRRLIRKVIDSKRLYLVVCHHC